MTPENVWHGWFETVSLKTVVSRILRGHRKVAIFAVTTECNCSCLMCDMWRQPRRRIGLEDAKKILEWLNKNGFLIAYFTGGEPTLHPEIAEMVRYADGLGLVTSLTTNGTNPERIKEFEGSLHTISVSYDHWNPEVWEEIRGHEKISEKGEASIRVAKRLGMRPYALTYINPFLTEGDSIGRIVGYANKVLGVPNGFCYPVMTDETSYRLGGDLVEYPSESRKAIKKLVVRLLHMQRLGCRIANPRTYLEEIIRFHEKKPPIFYCKGGEDVVYIDWNGDVHPCFEKEPFFNVLEEPAHPLKKNVRCNECLTNCFREPSILAQMLSSPRGLSKGLGKEFSGYLSTARELML
ncbi:MAG: radical SAM/SPASM domain-containing protein [Candidatus Bathyarchaeia archaeon]